MNDIDAIPPPRDALVRPSKAAAGCAVVALLALLLPFLYVASFAYLYADAQNRWGLMDSVDRGWFNFFHEFYWPLIWLCERGL